MPSDTITQILAVCTVFGDVFILGSILLWIGAKFGYKRCGEWWMQLMHILKPRALVFGFIIALLSAVGSLFYSEIAGFAPCMLCWYQRIVMYPQVILLGMAQAKKDTGIAAYSLVLSVIGFVIATFHYIEQVTYNPLIPCSNVGYIASCVDKYFFIFGYITMPMMSMTAFGLMILCMIAVKKK